MCNTLSQRAMKNDTGVICMVVENDVININVGSEETFNVAEAHTQIVNYLKHFNIQKLLYIK